MHRSSSASRASDEFLINLSPPPKGSPGFKVVDIEYDPMSDDVTKKESSSRASGEEVIHIIPLIIILCSLTLWVFSHPVNITRTGGMITEKVEGLDAHPHGNQTTLIPTKEPKTSDHPKRIKEGKTARRLLVDKAR